MVHALTTTVTNAARYGATELKDLSHRYWLSGLTISIVLHVVVLVYFSLGGNNTVIHVRPEQKRNISIGSPPIPGTPSIPAAPKGSTTRRELGVPVPVANDLAKVDEAPLTQTGIGNTEATGAGNGVEGGGTSDVFCEIEEPPEVYVPGVEKYPQVVTRATPVYPPVALRAGLEGKVWVKIWVNKEGRVRDVVLVRSDNDIFTQAALEAARQFLFTPAYVSTGPVAVWVSVPFHFKLAEH
ncbi:MAG: energy transducer TonB [Bacteroidota bacterium]